MTRAVHTHSRTVCAVSSVNKGFTLVELVITLILIGILSVVATTRFQSASGFDTFALQGQTLSLLRHMQFRAMQDTRQTYCHRVVLDIAAPALGIPSNDYSDSPLAAASTCSDSIGESLPDYLQVPNSNFTQSGASLNAIDGAANINWIEFDSLGRPRTNIGRCVNGCQIELSAESSSSVCINREGFIRAC